MCTAEVLAKTQFLIVSVFMLCSGVVAKGQNVVSSSGSQDSGISVCTQSAEVAAKPTRPNLTYSTDTTQCGVVEVDYGWASQWPGGTRQDVFSGSMRFGVTPKVDVRWGGATFVSSYTAAMSVQGTGDNWFGARCRFHEQSSRVPSLGVSYNVKLPSASPEKSLGTGYVDHEFTLLAGKDFGKFHFDSNLVGTLAGASSGFQNSTLVSLACWRPLSKRFSLVTESYGGTQAVGSPFASVLTGAAYSLTPRFVVDGAVESPVIANGPGKRVTLGATYALGNLYRWFAYHPAPER